MNILHIKSSINGENSMSNKLSNEIIAKIQSAHSEYSLTILDLGENPLPYINLEQLGAYNVPEEMRSDEQKALVKHSDSAIAQIKKADIIVIGVPLYNFSIPARLKTWIDQISKANETFSYAKGTSQGLLLNKKVYLAIASGGIYSEGYKKDFDFAQPYLCHALSFLGMTDTTVFRVEGLVVPDIKDTAFEKALATINQYNF